MTTGILVRRLLRNNSAISDDIIAPQPRHLHVSQNIFKRYIVGNLIKNLLTITSEKKKRKKKKESKYRIQRTVERLVSNYPSLQHVPRRVTPRNKLIPGRQQRLNKIK